MPPSNSSPQSDSKHGKVDDTRGATPSTPEPMIVLKDISVAYAQGIPALAEVCLTVQRGEFVFLVGPTGAGKSTLLKLLYREERPTQGSVFVDGQNLNVMRLRQIPQFRRQIGIVFQDYGLLPNKTVYENVVFALRVIGASRKEIRKQVPHALEQVSMAHRPDAFPHQLSGGEQQRVAIARALVNDPPLLIADEPTGNLDPDTSQGIVELLCHISANGTTVIVATHDSAIVDRMQRRVVAFEQGRLVRDENRGAYRSSEHVASESPSSASSAFQFSEAELTAEDEIDAILTGAGL